MGLAAFKTYSTVLYSTELSLHSGSGGPWIVSDVSAVFLHQESWFWTVDLTKEAI